MKEAMQLSLDLFPNDTDELYLQAEPIELSEAEQQERIKALQDDLDPNSCITIFRAVILQAIIDMRSQSTKEERIRFKQEAIEWYASEDYPIICDLAHVDENMLSEEIEAIIQGRKGKEGTSDFRVLRKKKLKNRTMANHAN